MTKEKKCDIKQSNTKLEAFSFGLKFDTEIQNGNLVDTIVKS